MTESVTAAYQELADLVRGYQRSQALTVAARLGIADLLRDGPRTVADLARATATHEPTLYRLLRALAAIGVFLEGERRTFSLGATGQYLRTDHPLSVDPLARMFCAAYEWRAWGDLLHSVRTGENAARHALGVDVWEYRRQHPEEQEVFDAAMRTLSRALTPGFLAAHDFGRYRVLADVGGGTGALLASVLRAHPGLRGLLFDQPQVLAGAGDVLREAGVADRVTVVPGDFFAEVPDGADAYLLSRILHDWPDDEARAILRRVRAALGPEAVLLVHDAVVGPPNTDAPVAFLDLMMLVSAGGRERTEAEWRQLFEATGLRWQGAVRVGPSTSLVTAVPG
ncbi:methyltransferase [Geodermatophilus sp. SYSU D00697]